MPKPKGEPTCSLPPPGRDRIPWPTTRRRPIDLRSIVAEANQRWFMWHVGDWLEREWPWLFEGVIDGDDCYVCRWPLGGAFVGVGDGSGTKFAHLKCAPLRGFRAEVEG